MSFVNRSALIVALAALGLGMPGTDYVREDPAPPPQILGRRTRTGITELPGGSRGSRRVTAFKRAKNRARQAAAVRRRCKR